MRHLLRARNVGWACAVTCVAALLVLVQPGAVQAPITGETVSLPYLWPAASVVPTLLVSRSRMRVWEGRASRPVGLYHAAVLLVVWCLGAASVVLLQPAIWRPLLATSLVLQACALLAGSLLGEWSWLLVAALASLTIVRDSLVQDVLVYSAAGDRTLPTMRAGGATYLVGVVVAGRSAMMVGPAA